jgi:uncharacterized membrane protein
VTNKILDFIDTFVDVVELLFKIAFVALWAFGLWCMVRVIIKGVACLLYC